MNKIFVKNAKDCVKDAIKKQVISNKDELLKVNGRLFQKVGFDKEEKEDAKQEEVEGEEMTIEDIVDEKGELI